MVCLVFFSDRQNGLKCLATSSKEFGGHNLSAPLEISQVPNMYQSPYGMTSYF